jgi:hypothetical protein
LAFVEVCFEEYSEDRLVGVGVGVEPEVGWVEELGMVELGKPGVEA